MLMLAVPALAKQPRKILAEPWNDPDVMKPGDHHNLPLYSGPKPSAEAQQHMSDLFWDMDKNGDGYVNHNEAIGYIHAQHDLEVHAERMHAYHHADMKEEGHKLIDQTFEEMFGKGLEKAKGSKFQKEAHTKALHMFSLMDLDGDGTATAREQVKWKMADSKKHIDKEMHELITEHDYDLNGKLDRSEMKLIRSHRLVALSKRLAILSKHPELEHPKMEL